ncbi:MAG: SDR family oxidoreductase [Balneolaceae bacterium]|nr:SDR family oxidoreductase [Balneolaceae bacterium]
MSALNPEHKEMKNKVAVVTGAASGIGRATAVAFARQGVKVTISDVDAEGLEETLQMVEKEGSAGLSLVTDISKPDQIEKMVKETLNDFGRLDYACNNAGIEGVQQPTADYPVDEWDRMMNINLRGQWLCMKHEIPAMLKGGGGSIINISSILGKVGFAQAPAYVAAKHGLIGLTKAAAIEYSAENIRINAVCPAFINTPMLERADITTDKETREMIISMHPIGRLGTSEEVAAAVVWLASDEASFVTGHSLMVDGGYTAR